MFRVGELVMAFSALIFLITLMIFKPIYEEKYKSIFQTSILILLTFGMTIVFTGSNLLNLYTYKAINYHNSTTNLWRRGRDSNPR